MDVPKMGKSLIRAKKKRQLANRQNFQAILDLEQRQHTATETAPKLQSVWHTSNLDDVLYAAGEREEGYAALRDVRVVVSGATYVVSGDKVAPQSNDTRDWYGLSEKLPIPERPKWNFRMKAEDVQMQEKQSFADWRRALARFEEADKVVMTPFEKNVEVWRQLWRVVEKSDIVLEIVDARNPLAFRSAGLERYVAKHNTRRGLPKECVLLLNKSDLLTETQRKHWATYLTSKGVKFFFFSAKPLDPTATAESHQDPTAELKAKLEEAALERDADDEDDSGSDDDEEEGNNPSPAGNGRPAAGTRGGGGAAMLETERLHAEVMERERAAALSAVPKKERRRKDRKITGAPTKVANPHALKSAKEVAEQRRLEREAEAAKERPLTAEEIERDRRLAQTITDTFKPWDILDPTTLLDALAVMREHLGVTANEPILVGMAGYPNVGKSSTINAIIMSKKVVVSATPGKTKHFQTLTIPNERRLTLCDCPGLVFPSFASTKEAMVCDGVLPIDTCRDYLAAVAVVCNRVPRGVLERQYVLVLEKENDVDASSSRAEFFLNQLSRRKGFMTEHDKPNRYRSAHCLLKDYVDGKVVYVHPPPQLQLEDPNPPAAPKAKKPKSDKPAAAAAASSKDTKDEEEGEWATDNEADDADGDAWETASDDDGEDWEDVSDADVDRHLSDVDKDSEADEGELEPLSFYGTTNFTKRRPLNTAEVFNLEHNFAVVDALEEARPKKRKINHMLVPDESYRINRHGEKELLLDDDDEIVITGEVEKKDKAVSKRTHRRQAKRGLVAARGAKPAALPGVYQVRTGELDQPASVL
jgi:large subunit GTPase 1